MRRPLPADDQVNAVMTRVLAQAAETGRKPTVTAVERDLRIAHATFDRNYRHLIDGFRQRAHDQAAAAKQTRAIRSGKDPDQVMQRLRRENERGSSRSTPNPSASSHWTTSNSKRSSTPPPASPPCPPTRTNQARTAPAPSPTAVKPERAVTEGEHPTGANSWRLPAGCACPTSGPGVPAALHDMYGSMPRSRSAATARRRLRRTLPAGVTA
jgi:hypothetical protein